MPSRSLEVDSMDDTDAPQGGEEHAPVADMGGLSTLSAAASKRILEDGDPDLFGSGSELMKQRAVVKNIEAAPAANHDDYD